MAMQLITGQQRIAASDVEKALREKAAEPHILQRHVIEGDLDLRFAHITRCIEITDCEFTGTVDVRNAVFDGTVLFRNCLFWGNVNAGDEELSHTLFKADLSFDGSVFRGFVSFIGFRCEASAYFINCKFKATAIRESKIEITGKRPPVEFSGGKVGKEFYVNKSVFKGSVSFNALCCDLAGFFHDVRFDSCEAALPVNFVASSYGVACELDRAVFQGGADFGGISCGLFFSAKLARFCHSEHYVSFANSKTDYFLANGAMFEGPTWFTGLRCNKDANFSPYVPLVPFDYPAEEQWPEGDIPPRLKTQMKKEFGRLFPRSASLVREDAIWTLRSPKIPVRWSLSRDGNKVSVSIPTAFVGSLFTIASADIGLDLSFLDAAVRATADFSNLLCKGSGRFDRVRFAESVNFSSSQWEGDISLNAATFEREVSFDSCHLRNLNAYGSRFAGNANFSGFTCHNARFDPYQIPLDDEMFGHLAEGPLPAELRSMLAEHGFHLPESCTFNRRNDKWLVLDENGEQRAYIEFSDGQLFLKVISQFLGEGESLILDHGQVGWFLVLNSAHVKGAATFNALHCTAGSFFRNTQFDGKVDMRYGEYGINLQIDGAQFKSMAKFNSISIKHELVISGEGGGAIFHEGADFTGTKIGRLRIGSSNPFRKKQTVFIGCNFDFFDGEWRKIVDQQDRRHFSLDPYLMLERCARAAGRHDEADDIYHKGKSRETWRALAQLRLLSFFKGVLWDALAGYGVRKWRLGIWCVLVVALGVAVFWSSDALRPAVKGEDAVPLYTAQLTQPLSHSDSNAGEACTGLFGDFSSWTMPKLEGWLREFDINVNFDGRMFDRVVSRLAYSIDAFVPLDLEIAKHCRPAPSWRQAYYAIHILAGWILIPWVVAAVTGFFGKR